MGRSSKDDQRRRFWRKVMARWRGSDQSITAFCRREGLAVSTFYLWRRRLKKEQQEGLASPAFVPVRVVNAEGPASAQSEGAGPGHDASSSPIELVRGCGGWTVRLRAGFDRVALRALLDVLDGRRESA